MKRLDFAIFAFFALLLVCGSGNAGVIGGIRNGTFDSSGTPGLVPLPNLSATISITNAKRHVPQEIAFEVANTSGAMFEYQVTVNMINNSIHPLSSVRFETALTSTSLAAGSPTNLPNGIGFDRSSPFGDSIPVPTSTYNTVQFPSWTQQEIWFGGVLGGGGELLPGQTGTFVFRVNVPDGPENGNLDYVFSIRMTANPEPGSLVLGGLALAACGGLVWRRRSKKSQAA